MILNLFASRPDHPLGDVKELKHLLSEMDIDATVLFEIEAFDSPILPDGSRRNNMEVTRTLADLPLTQFSLHQRADGSLEFRFRGSVDLIEPVRQRLQSLLQQPLQIERVEGSLGPKWIAYSSDF